VSFWWRRVWQSLLSTEVWLWINPLGFCPLRTRYTQPLNPVFNHQDRLALRELSISPEACQGGKAAISLLTRRKVDAVIVDFQLREQAGVIMDEVRLSASNRTAVTFAIGGGDVDATAAFRKRAGFVFGRPLSPQSIRNTLKPAYGLILRERRRYFRCPISNPGYSNFSRTNTKCWRRLP
jgi:hypothetical protein